MIMVAGAGYAGLHVALCLTARLRNEPMMELTLVDRHDYHQALTELPRVTAGDDPLWTGQQSCRTSSVAHTGSRTQIIPFTRGIDGQPGTGIGAPDGGGARLAQVAADDGA